MRTRWRLPPLLGPLFGYDLVAATRRGQHAGLRALVAVTLLVTLYILYASKVPGFDPFANPFIPGPRMDGNAMANFARDFVSWCMIVQFGAVVLITPIVVADAIAREKERRALDFLFVTALTDREIILGKLGSRLAYMVGIILTGLPIVALTTFFGGVEPEMLICSYAAVLATLFSLGALSMYCSVVSQTALQATIRAYAAAAGYMMVCPCVLVPLITSDAAVPGLIAYVIVNLAFAWVLVLVSKHDLRPRAELLPPVPLPLRPRVKRSIPTVIAVEPEDRDLPFVLPAGPPVATTPGALVGWDPAEWRQLDRQIVWEPPELPRPPLPPVDENRPLLWKEIYLHSIAGAAPGGPSAVAFVLIVGAALASLLWVAVALDPKTGGDVADFSTALVKVGTVVLGGLLGLGVIAHSVNSVSRELEKDTLDGLLTLPVERESVLAAKWLGGLVSLRLLGMTLVCVWVFGLATGGLHPYALATLVLSVVAVIEFLASLGLWLSAVSKTSLRANMAAVLSLLALACGPWIVGNYIEMFAPNSRVSQFADTVPGAAMPAVAWVRSCVGWRAYSKLPEGHFPAILLAALAYAALAWLLWRATLQRFYRYGGKRPG